MHHLSLPGLCKTKNWEDKRLLSLSTIKGYKSMLSSVFKHRGIELASNSDIWDLIKSFTTTKSPVDTKSIAWNLDVVLKFLSGPPFEPLMSACLRGVIRKALSLLALSTAKRVGELYALDREVGFIKEGVFPHLHFGLFSEEWRPFKALAKVFFGEEFDKKTVRDPCVQSEFCVTTWVGRNRLEYLVRACGARSRTLLVLYLRTLFPSF